jgi:hypothetical protein
MCPQLKRTIFVDVVETIVVAVVHVIVAQVIGGRASHCTGRDREKNDTKTLVSARCYELMMELMVQVHCLLNNRN